MKFTKKIKKKWIDALRGGEYEQGVGAYCRVRMDGSAEYCVLGVLYEATNGEGAWMETGGNWLARNWQMVCTPPEPPLSLSLACMNDGGISFDELADYIEREIPHE